MQSSKIEKKLLHYTGKAIADYNLIQTGDRILVCLSGGKDSFAMLNLLRLLRLRTNNKFELFIFVLDQMQPGWDDSDLRVWLQKCGIPFEILRRDTYSVVKNKVLPGKSYCSFCARLRRGVIYRYAKEHGFTKIALGHHRDDLIETMLMSIMYSGVTRSMPPKLLTDDKRHIVIRPLAYCQEKDIIVYAKEQQFPVVSCGLCNNQKVLMRNKIKELIADLSKKNPKVPSNILHAVGNIKPSQLMDRSLWDFKLLESKLEHVIPDPVS